MASAISTEQVGSLYAALDELAPLIRAHADEAERARRLPKPVSEALRQAGFFRMFRPRARGGWGLDPVSEFRVAEALARIDGAAAWNVQVCNAGELYGAWLDEGASARVFGRPDSVVAGAFNPHRRAVPCEGGYRVTGRTPFTSHCQGADWIMGLADVYDGDEQVLDDEGEAQTLLVLAPSESCEIIENWDTLGLCGTGSHDVAMRNVFVPSSLAVPFGPLRDVSPAYDHPLSRLVIWVTAGSHAAVALGIAQSAIDALVDLGGRVPAYTQSALRDRSRVQHGLALAEGRLAGARAFFHQAYAEAWEAVADGAPLDMVGKARCQLACSTATSTAAEAVDLVHGCVGTAGIRKSQPFERCFRDVHVITQHAFVSEARLEAVGQVMLGLEPDWAFFQL